MERLACVYNYYILAVYIHQAYDNSNYNALVLVYAINWVTSKFSI